MDLNAALDVAVDEFGRRVAMVGPEQWSSTTPCDGWDVRYLVAHVVGGNRFAVAVLDGRSSRDAISEVMSSPQLGADPVEAWATTVAAQAAAFQRPNVLDTTVDHPVGPVIGRELLQFRVFDVTLHAWDLARAIGADETLADELVAAVLDIVGSGPPGMGFGIEAVAVPPDASPQERLLALSGRNDRGSEPIA